MELLMLRGSDLSFDAGRYDTLFDGVFVFFLVPDGWLQIMFIFGLIYQRSLTPAKRSPSLHSTSSLISRTSNQAWSAKSNLAP